MESHPSVRMAEVLAALSLATDLGAGKPMGHAIRACMLGMKLAGGLRLSTTEQAELYYSFLLMHSGCTALSLGLSPVIRGDELAAIGEITLDDDANPLVLFAWMIRNVSPGAPLPERVNNVIQMLLHSRESEDHLRGACEVAVRVAQRLGMPPGVQEAVRYYLERWDGKGPYGLAGSEIHLKARLLQLALKLEAISTARGRDEAEDFVVEQQGKIFDPHLAAVFLDAVQNAAFWELLELDDPWQAALELEPDSPYRNINEAKLDDLALAVADFIDLKSASTVGHSRETARIAEGIASRMGLPAHEIANLRRAALVHDLGHIALPGLLLAQHSQPSEADKERLRLHPYYTERILSRVPALAQVAAIAGKHHERMNGTGYYRGLSGSEMPVSACILAIADEFQERLHAHPGQPEPDPKDVVQGMSAEAGTLFFPEGIEALAQEFGLAALKPHRKREWPAGLTEREVEVLRWVAKGTSNRQIAKELVVSEKTVAHHLEHIYNKIGISSRAAAVYFAMENELIP